MVLVLVLIVVALLALAGYTFSEMMLAEYEATEVHGRSVQAHLLADSGVQMARLFLAQDQETQIDSGGHYDNPTRFRSQLVLDDDSPVGRGRFTIISPSMEDDGGTGIRYGLEDESIRLNLNILLYADKQAAGAGRTLLMALPGMTEEIADAILDWIDPDDETREFGAEIDEYSGYTPPYAPKNGPLETVEELLLVRGITPALLFGSDANRNGIADAHEAATNIGDVDNSDGSLNRGWSGYLTLYSMEANLKPDGTPRININGDDLEQLFNDLSAVDRNWAQFIVAYRQNNAYSGTAKAQAGYGGNLDLTKPSKATFGNILDLIGARTQVKFQGASENVVLDSPFKNDPLVMGAYLPKMMENLTVNPQQVIPGRININQAPKWVLLGIPGMSEEIVEKIISDREPEPSADLPGRQFETWLMAEAIVTLDQMKQMMPFVTGRGSVYRAQVIGYFEERGPAARIEAILDASTTAPKLLFWRDLTHLGRGFTVETLGIQALR